MDLELKLAHWSIGGLAPETLPNLAVELLELGYASEALEMLAGESCNPAQNTSETIDLFERCVKELSLQIPPAKEAARLITTYHCNSIICGNVTPYEGAKAIVEEVHYITYDEGGDIIPGLSGFIGYEDEYLEFQKDYRLEFYGEERIKELLKETEQGIIKTAKQFLERYRENA